MTGGKLNNFWGEGDNPESYTGATGVIPEGGSHDRKFSLPAQAGIQIFFAAITSALLSRCRAELDLVKKTSPL